MIIQLFTGNTDI